MVQRGRKCNNISYTNQGSQSVLYAHLVDRGPWFKARVLVSDEVSCDADDRGTKHPWDFEDSEVDDFIMKNSLKGFL